MHSIQSETLSDDWVLSFAKDALRPFTCEWGTCPTTLNSANAFQKHVHLHCKHTTKGKDSTRRCEWRACLFHVPSSRAELLKHVEASHLARLPLRCPLQDCSEMFSHHQLLLEHFFHVHTAFRKGDSVAVFLPFARRSARLTTPLSRDLPPLPTKPVSWAFFDEACNSLRQEPLQTNAPSQSQNLVSCGRKRRRKKLEDGRGTRQVRLKGEHIADEESEDDCNVRLSNMRHESRKHEKLKSASQILLRRRAAKTWATIEKELGTPPIPKADGDLQLRLPPLSFGFEKVKEEAAGL